MAVQTITYDDKSYLNQNSDIADVNKVNDTDMNMIKSVVNNNATETSNNTTAITSLNTYSTSEIAIGTYTNGETIYKQTFTGSYTSSSSRVTVNLVSGIAKVVNCYGMYSPNTSTPNTEFGAAQLGSAGGVDAYSQLQLTSAGVVRACFTTPQSQYSGLTGSFEVTVEYTKTS